MKRSGDLNIKTITSINEIDNGITIRNLSVNDIDICIGFIEQITDRTMLINSIIKPLINSNINSKDEIDFIVRSILNIDSVIIDDNENKIIDYIEKGSSVIALSSDSKYIIANTKTSEKRTIETPQMETTIKGPKDSFVENIDTNISLIRYRIKDKNLKVNSMEIGRRTKTKVAILYINDIVNYTYLDRIIQNLNNADIDGISTSASIQQIISMKKYNLFPVVGTIERSDQACTNLLQGKIVIIIDGGGIVLTAPQTFLEFFDSADDYYESIYLNLLVKSLRLLSFFISLTISSFYIAVVAFHPDILPASYILALASARSTVPFNAFFEAFLMEFIAEILREASLRLPKQIGSAIGIVGTIVIGQAAVVAGLVSPLMVIIVAISLMGSFAIPNFSVNSPLRVLKFGLIILTSIYGLLGFIMGLIMIIYNIICTSSFGVPYLQSIAPYHFTSLRNFFLGNILLIKKRPEFLKTKNVRKSFFKRR